MTTAPAASALHDFIHAPQHLPAASAVATPYTVFSVERALAAYDELVQALPLTQVLYAVKAAPFRELIAALNLRGAGCDVASPAEIDLCLQAGVPAERLSYGNPIRTADEVGFAAAAGIRTWVVDTALEVQRVALAAPGSRVIIRVANNGEGADWPLSGKFGCSPAEAVALGRLADSYHLEVGGLSWHVGSQQRHVSGWDAPLRQAAQIWRTLAVDGIRLQLLNLGGGLPCDAYRVPAPPLADYAHAITAAVDRYFPDHRPQLAAEPGRSLVAAAGATVTTVKAVVDRPDGRTYVFLDGGIFSIGLVEAIDSVIEYHIEALGYSPSAPTMPVALVGPTCDSLDEIAARTPYELPRGIGPGDRVAIWATGAYTHTYSSLAFNGYRPAELVVVP